MKLSHRSVYIVAAKRTPVAKARGQLAHVRPDDLLVHSMQAVLSDLPSLPREKIDDVIVGCAMPEAEQGMNIARNAVLLADLPVCISAMTINRFCASGLEAIAMAASRIGNGEAEVVLAGGAESMSLVPMGGHKLSPNPALFNQKKAQIQIAFGMGITAEKVAKQWQISREAQDQFALQSHRRALQANATAAFSHEIAPIQVTKQVFSSATQSAVRKEYVVTQDEGPRANTDGSALAKLKPVFQMDGTVTAGNTSQMSDGAATVALASEQAVKDFQLTPLARFVAYRVAGVAPEHMGIGPVAAIPKALHASELQMADIAWIELNEAFAAQSLAVCQALDLDGAIVNPLGGAIALGHPLGATGAIRACTVIHGLQARQARYGMVTMCIGTGMGAAGIFERV